MIPETEYTYTVEHFKPGILQIDDYFQLGKWLKEYEDDAKNRLSGLYESYTAYTYDDTQGPSLMAAGVEWRAMKAIEIKERLQKVRQKVLEKRLILNSALQALNDRDRLILLTHYQTGENIVSHTALHECKKRLQERIGWELYFDYLDRIDQQKEENKQRLKQVYGL